MGGVEQLVLDLAQGLMQRGSRVAVICYDAEGVAPMREALRACGVDVHPLRGGPALSGRIQRFRHLLGIFRRYRGGVVHLIEGWPARDGLAIVAAKLAGAGPIVRTEGEPPAQPVSVRQRLLSRVKDRLLARIVCLSEANRREHIELIGREPEKTVLVLLGIHLERFDRAGADRERVRALIGASNGAVVVGAIGRIHEGRKGAQYFVEMARAVSARSSGERFVMVGDGPGRARLEAAANGSVTFVGRYPTAADAYAAMDVVVIPSLVEGGPYTLLEAMAMGCPVVATSVGMVPEVIEDGVTGRVVPPGDTNALAEAVRSMTADLPAARAMAARGQATVRARYSVDAMVERYAALYRDVLGT
jgi:glycosyltransferase involved in cell wall biosynthesis